MDYFLGGRSVRVSLTEILTRLGRAEKENRRLKRIASYCLRLCRRIATLLGSSGDYDQRSPNGQSTSRDKPSNF